MEIIGGPPLRDKWAVWRASGRHLGDKRETTSTHLGNIWETLVKPLGDDSETTSGRELGHHILETSGRQVDNTWRNLGGNWERTSGEPHLGDNWDPTGQRQVEEIEKQVGDHICTTTGRQLGDKWKTWEASGRQVVDDIWETRCEIQ